MDKFGMQNAGWITLQGRGSIGMSMWRGISKGWSRFKENVEWELDLILA